MSDCPDYPSEEEQYGYTPPKWLTYKNLIWCRLEKGEFDDD